MATALWQGRPAAEAVARALRRQGLRLGRRTAGGGEDHPLVVHTRSGRRPPVPRWPARRWVWVADEPVPASVRREAVLGGAYDVICLTGPGAAIDLAARVTELAAPDGSAPPAGPLVLESGVSRAVAAQVARVAATSMSVLLTGETGTGKEVMARLIHQWSPRQAKPFVPINCAAIPDELMEAELFGYVRGAFSGAVQRYDGQLMAAEGGSVFLDEIHETSLETQVKLLRVLEDRVVSRLGENVWHEVDFRLIAATNRDLGALIEAGLFGADLYERLAIVTIRLPPLRDRLEDLPHLARHFMDRFAREQRRPAVTDLTPDALAALEAYAWPGNIRELRNVLYETLVYKRVGTSVLLSDLPRRILVRGSREATDAVVDRGAVTRRIVRGTMNLRDEVQALERLAVEEALARSGGNAAQAARLLGAVGRGVARDPGGTLRAMMRRFKT